MEVSEQSIADLKSEASVLYREYRRLKEAGRVAPLEEEAKQRLQGIRARYSEIEAELNQADNHSSDEIAHLSSIEIKPFRAHKPVTQDYPDSVLDNVFLRLSPRLVISSVLAVLLMLVVALVFTKNIGFFVVPSSSMEPTLVPNDKLMTMRKSTYERGDVIVLHDPNEEGAFLVKRIVALENDDVYVHQGKIIVNSSPIREPYIKEAMKYEFGPYRIPNGHVFVLGDNRNESDDSHEWGHGVPLDTVIGQVKYIYAPSERSGALPEVNRFFAPAES